MVSVIISTNDVALTIELHVKGHADSGEYGHDLICASVSILTYTYASIVDGKDRGFFLKEPVIELAEGEANIVCQPKTMEAYEELLTELGVVQRGYELLRDDYPDHVRVKLFGNA